VVEPEALFKAFLDNGVDFFAGVPDSLLKDFCAYITDHTSKSSHVITANEGGAIALVAGRFLGTGKLGLAYMQNSGQGNAVNPLLSLADPDVCGIPMVLLVGWRGEPGTEDEPQHVKQGKVTRDLFDAMGIAHTLLPPSTSEAIDCVRRAIAEASSTRAPYAIVARADTFGPYRLRSEIRTSFEFNREGALRLVLESLEPDAVVVGTTGKTSRELFELRGALGQSHALDFRTVGCMGHASQIALGIALAQKDRAVYCLDGDGAVLMHMGGLAIIASQDVPNLKHIVFNNGAHDSVGGQPTVALEVDIPAIAGACGYRSARAAQTREEIVSALRHLRQSPGPALLEIKVNKGARSNLGRPSVSPQANKQELLARLV
jgi:phosphonopyruvate decarboxylase